MVKPVVSHPSASKRPIPSKGELTSAFGEAKDRAGKALDQGLEELKEMGAMASKKAQGLLDEKLLLERFISDSKKMDPFFFKDCEMSAYSMGASERAFQRLRERIDEGDARLEAFSTLAQKEQDERAAQALGLRALRARKALEAPAPAKKLPKARR
jgi:phage shock protein A